ncbi:MAG: hypothetical protein QOE83_599 [Actinomycetota bacterium]|jgi:hypothetical protein|nr:hypothetical protein [Actinomycetota bacterium]
MLHKLYGDELQLQRRYAPAKGVEGRAVPGSPDPEHVSASYLERGNLTLRMGMRRFARLPNGFSKKIENHVAAVALHFQFYNFAPLRKSLNPHPRTPAMAASVADHIWTLNEIRRTA